MAGLEPANNALMSDQTNGSEITASAFWLNAAQPMLPIMAQQSKREKKGAMSGSHSESELRKHVKALMKGPDSLASRLTGKLLRLNTSFNGL